MALFKGIGRYLEGTFVELAVNSEVARPDPRLGAASERFSWHCSIARSLHYNVLGSLSCSSREVRHICKAAHLAVIALLSTDEPRRLVLGRSHTRS